jgi:hypothetical protein
MAYVKIAKDKKGQALHKNDNVYYKDHIWAVDSVAGTRLYLSFFGATAIVEAKEVTKYR